MARIDFAAGQKDVCPVCFLRKGMTDPDKLATSRLELGSMSAVIADSPTELGELFASACPPHQQGLTQFIYALSQVAGVDYRAVFARIGAREAGPSAESTVIHLVVKGLRTVCGRNVEEKWSDSERFVYLDKLHAVNCPACRNQQTS